MSPDRWYLRILAAYYGLVCGISSIRYIYLDLHPAGASVPWLTQLLCFGTTVGAILYFFHPRLGHRCLVVLTTMVVVLAASGGDGRGATFHLIVLGMLCLPLIAGQHASRCWLYPRPLRLK